MTVAFFIQMLTEQPGLYFTIIAAVIVSIVLHELGHGVAAIWQGDDTPRATGHMTLNPLVHMPPISLGLLFLAGITFGLMPVNPSRFRSRYGSALVAAAGPAVNLVLAVVTLTTLGLLLRFAGAPERGGAAFWAMEFLFQAGRINLLLLMLNLLPIPPLDGSTVLAGFSRPYRRIARDRNNQPFFMGAFVLVIAFANHIHAAVEEIVDTYLRLFV